MKHMWQAVQHGYMKKREKLEVLNKNRMRLEITKKMYIKNVDLEDLL